MLLHYKTLTDTAIDPVKAHPEDAAWDLYADETKVIYTCETIKTGIAIRIPTGMVGMVCSRSGLAKNNGVFVLNAPGIIDPMYSGEISVVLGALQPYEVKAGDRIAQLIIMNTADVTLLGSANMVWSGMRGDDGFGSSGR